MAPLAEPQRPKPGAGLGWTLHVLEVHSRARHGEGVYPAGFTVLLTRDDGLSVEIVGLTVSKIGPVPVTVTIRAGDGIRHLGDYRLPIPSLTREAARLIAQALPATPERRVPERIGPLPRLRRGDAPGDAGHPERLQFVAATYRHAIEDGENVGQAVAAACGVSKSRAYQLIHEATNAGLLPRMKPGQKRA